MELYECKKTVRSVKAALAVDGRSLPNTARGDGIMLLTGKLTPDEYLSPLISKSKLAKQPNKRTVNLYVFLRALQFLNAHMTECPTHKTLTALNKALYGDFERQAGKLRAEERCTFGNAHTSPKYISSSLKKIISKMNDTPSADVCSKHDFAGYISHYMRELYILHPMETGSELTVRIFIMLFCELKGFSLCFYRVPPSQIAESERVAFCADDIAPLYNVLDTCLSYSTAQKKPKKTSAHV